MIVSDWAPVVGVSAIALSAGAAVVLRGPIGKALAQWIGGWSHTEAKWIEAKMREGGGATGGEVEQLRAAVDELRSQLAEVQERLDFAERMLAKTRDAERLPPVR
jgi:transposase-like protein